MLDFAGLQSVIKARLDEDREIRVIETSGKNLEEAINEAANTLSVSVKNLEYEVIEESSTFMGIGKDFCKIRAFETKESKKAREEKLISKSAAGAEEEIDIEFNEDRDGEAFVQRRPSGVFLKVTPKTGRGRAATEEIAASELKRRKITEYDESIVKKVVDAASGEYVRVANYAYSKINDSAVVMEISETEMTVYITVSPPGPGGADLTYEKYCEYLRANNVVFGINDIFLSNFADKPIYHQKVSVANGKRAVNGKDAYIEYYFETGSNNVRIKENPDGKVDFKELNIIQNVLKGERLAKKIPAEKGEEGTTVTGKTMQGRDGRDISAPLGENVSFAEDGETIVADINGQIVFAKGKISVNEVYVVPGSINLQTGNIVFLGSIVITGDVEEGFTVKASGNVEVHGYVDRSTVTADGDVVVFKGIKGKESASVSAGQNIWTKFIENANISAGNNIIVSDGIVNSSLMASKEIICNGKTRANIVGGKHQAGESILAQTIGSKSGNTETFCEVGYDPLLKHKIEKAKKARKAKEDEIESINAELQMLMAMREQRGGLPDEKLTRILDITDRKSALLNEISESKEEQAKLEEGLRALRTKAKISAIKIFYAGVIINVYDKSLKLLHDYTATTFLLENGLIHNITYNEEEDRKKLNLEQPAQRKR